MADSVVCRRVKECCVRLHSCVQKWQQLNSQGLDIANKLVQIVIQSKYTESEAAFGVLKGSSGLGPSIEGKLMMERELLYSQLVEIKDKMSAVVQEVGRLSGNMSAAVELVLCQGLNPEQPLFHTLPAAVYGSYFADLFRAYSEDMCAKESMVNDIMKQNDRDILTVYLLCWLHQPYINNQCSDKLETLLVDSGLRA